MARYWIADAKRRVLGPVGPEVLDELAEAGKLRDVLISRDGGEWAPPGSFPELAPIFAGRTPAERRDRERQEAERLWLLLDVLKEHPIHVVFGVGPQASREELRKAFFALVKRYHPDRVPADAHPELKAVYEATFEQLTARMAEHERRLRETARPPPLPPRAGVAPAPRPPTSGIRPPAARQPAPVPAASYRKEEFVGLERRTEDRVEARVKVTIANAGMFFENRLVNLSTGGVFLASQQLLPLDTLLDLIFDFEDLPGHRITCEGRVMWENAEAHPGQPRGFGVRLLRLARADLQFLKEFVRRATAPGR